MSIRKEVGNAVKNKNAVMEFNQLEGEHALVPAWSFWVWKADSDKWKPVGERTGNEWMDRLHKLCSINTIEMFWALHHRVIAANQLRYGTDYIFFREGIKPMWEDPKNVNGGLLFIDMERDCKHTKLNRYWLELLMAILGGQFNEFNKYINGAFLNVRSRGQRISIWIANCQPEVVHYIQNTVHSKLGLNTTDKIGFKKHYHKKY